MEEPPKHGVYHPLVNSQSRGIIHVEIKHLVWHLQYNISTSSLRSSILSYLKIPLNTWRRHRVRCCKLFRDVGIFIAVSRLCEQILQ